MLQNTLGVPTNFNSQEYGYHRIYVGNSINKLQIQVTTYIFELNAGNCHR